MPRIFLVAADEPRDRIDLEKSVVHPVDRQRVIRSFSDSTYPELIEIERHGHGFWAWGVAAHPEAIESWFQMARGDFLLIASKGAYRHYAKVLGRYQSATAARAIWGEELPEEEIREFLFFVSEPITVGQPLSAMDGYLPATFGRLDRVADDAIGRIEGEFGGVERFIRRTLLNSSAGGPLLDISGMIQLSEREITRLRLFDPESSKSGRTQVIESIIRRRGHPGFRQLLLAAYDYRCAITNSNAIDTLEATYILAHRGEYTQHPSNGLLLRADLHTLFDLGKIAIDTKTMTIVMTDDLAESSYRILAGRPLRYPRDAENRPSTEALDLHRRLAGL
jgi:hypothetical protein